MYTKDGCHLCERVLEKLLELNSKNTFTITTRDISKNKELFERYEHVIPVVEVNGKITVAGAALSNANTMPDVLRRAIFVKK